MYTNTKFIDLRDTATSIKNTEIRFIRPSCFPYLKKVCKEKSSIILLAFFYFLLPLPAEASLILSYEAAGQQNTSIIEPTIYESFNGSSFTTGTFPTSYQWEFNGTTVGTYSTKAEGINISRQDQYGGAQTILDSGTGSSQYLQVYGGDLLLNLSTPQGYVGFWWSAADNANAVDIITEDGHVYGFTTSALLNAIPRDTNPMYYGNPAMDYKGINAYEPYVFVNFFVALNDSKIQSIEYHGWNFEMDNLTVYTPYHTPTGSIITEGVTGNNINAVPEPSTSILVALGLFMIGGGMRFGKQRKAGVS